MPQPTLYASDKIGRSCQATSTSSFVLSDIKRSQAGPCVLYLYTYRLKLGFRLSDIKLHNIICFEKIIDFPQSYMENKV